MTRRAKPVVDPAKPGQYLPNGGSAKSGLSRAILSKGWFRFESALRSVSRYSGTQVVKVPAAFTSLRCSVCGHVDPKSRESQAVFRCIRCSRPAEHADVNAAKNILAAGLLAVISLWRRPVACGLWGILEAGTSRKPRGITAPIHTTDWNPADSSVRRTSIVPRLYRTGARSGHNEADDHERQTSAGARQTRGAAGCSCRPAAGAARPGRRRRPSSTCTTCVPDASHRTRWSSSRAVQELRQWRCTGAFAGARRPKAWT